MYPCVFCMQVTLYLFSFIELVCEVLISSCSMVSWWCFGSDPSICAAVCSDRLFTDHPIFLLHPSYPLSSQVTRRYFSWHGSQAGFLIAALGSLIIPAHFVVEIATHHYEERYILKVSSNFIHCSLHGILVLLLFSFNI